MRTKNFEMVEEKFVNEMAGYYEEMIYGKFTEEMAVELITTKLAEAKACQNNEECWFWMFAEPSEMEPDSRVRYVYEPTYYMTAAILYAMVEYPSVREIPGLMDKLELLLNGCMGRDFRGHGYNEWEGFLKTMKIFINANVHGFLALYKSYYPKFNVFFNQCIDLVEGKLATGEGRSMWSGTGYEWEAKELLRLYGKKENTEMENTCKVFVYGTLMSGQRAHSLLGDAKLIGKYRLVDYAMYDMGAYPAIYPCAGESVVGEVYEISTEKLPDMDRYEGEGSLYFRRSVVVSNALNSVKVYAYVYNRQPDRDIMRKPWGIQEDDMVWYACYGSNMCAERFRCYIEGGRCAENGRWYEGCLKNKSLWTDSAVATFAGEMYYGNASSSWGGKGVAFFDPSAEGVTRMRLYKITYGQLEEVKSQEGPSPSWYGRVVCLGVAEDGCPIYTLTSETRRAENEPSEAYKEVIHKGMMECEKVREMRMNR